VRNGVIKGINGSAVDLRDEAFVDGLRVSNTFLHGIAVGPRSLVTRSRVTAVGRSGLFLGAGSGYADNVIAKTGQFFAFGSVSGGKPTGGNVCDDGRCPGGRRFYLTQDPVNGAQALTVCEGGFHMASRWEIEDPTVLRYDRLRGFEYPDPSDQGLGPPSDQIGWIRSGASGNTASLVDFNCTVWTSTALQALGSSMRLKASSSSEGSPPEIGLQWVMTATQCAGALRVWCVEDD
jgi:hypothetical protein